MGYGLVDVPRRLWHHANRDRTLRYLEFTAATRRENLLEAKKDLADALSELAGIDRVVTLRDRNRPKVDTILKLAPSNFAATVAPPAGAGMSPYDIDDEVLVDLHCKLARRTVRNAHSTQYEGEKKGVENDREKCQKSVM